MPGSEMSVYVLVDVAAETEERHHPLEVVLVGYDVTAVVHVRRRPRMPLHFDDGHVDAFEEVRRHSRVERLNFVTIDVDVQDRYHQ